LTSTLARTLVAGFSIALLAGCARSQPAARTHPDASGAQRYAWVEITDRGEEVRAITPADHCPAVVVGGERRAMHERAGPSADFPVRTCELALTKGAARVSIGGRTLPLLKGAPKRIVIFGDTGCRLKGDAIQNCDRPADWPFAEVARLAAAHHPDLVIHVGDYYYRESPCPAGKSGCAGSPWGDNWTTWDADFFAPAAPLLDAAPWILVRGNHEDCERGGPGWFRLLDGAAAPATCPAAAAPMAIDLGDLELYVLDSSGTDDRKAPPDKVAAFAQQLAVLKAHPPTKAAWIVTHRPFWGLAPVVNAGPLGPIEVALNATEQAAARSADLSAIDMVVSGHIHHFASFTFQGNRPPQLIVGTGGDIGEPADTPKFIDGVVELDGLSARRFGFDRFGFLVLDRSGHDWTGNFYDVRDRPIAHCQLSERALACSAAPAPR
jgi:predicted phosphodiesterase